MTWEKYGKLYEHSKNQYTISHTQCPVPFEINKDEIRIFFSSRDIHNRSIPKYIDFNTKYNSITRTVSLPVLKLGKVGSFDDSGVMPQQILKHNGKVYLYYTGWHLRASTPFSTSVGLAISYDNGETFYKYSNGPILTISIHDPYFVGGHTVIIDNGLFRMWYLSCTQWKKIESTYEPVYLIKYAESIDGICWNVNNRICIDYKYDGETIARPYVIKDNNIYKMWYSPRSYNNFRDKNSSGSYRIGYAESIDGINWERMDEKAGIDVSTYGWDSQMIAYASIIIHKNKKIMFYNGNGFGKSGFGYAILNES